MDILANGDMYSNYVPVEQPNGQSKLQAAIANRDPWVQSATTRLWTTNYREDNGRRAYCDLCPNSTIRSIAKALPDKRLSQSDFEFIAAQLKMACPRIDYNWGGMPWHIKAEDRREACAQYVNKQINKALSNMTTAPSGQGSSGPSFGNVGSGQLNINPNIQLPGQNLGQVEITDSGSAAQTAGFFNVKNIAYTLIGAAVLFAGYKVWTLKKGAGED